MCARKLLASEEEAQPSPFHSTNKDIQTPYNLQHPDKHHTVFISSGRGQTQEAKSSQISLQLEVMYSRWYTQGIAITTNRLAFLP